MFSRKLFPIGLALTGFTLAILYFLLTVTPEDEARYQELIRSSTPSANQSQLSVEIAKQKREDIEKNIWFSQKMNRLHLRLRSERSTIQFIHTGKKKEIFEDLEEVACYMQESLYYLTPDGKKAALEDSGKVLVKGADKALHESWYEPTDGRLIPMQIIRHFEADRGLHNYTDDLFTAENVTITRFTSPGHVLSDEPEQNAILMKGLARSIDFSLGGAEVNFRAYKLKATFFNEGET
jgi:hypothetical protein